MLQSKVDLKYSETTLDLKTLLSAAKRESCPEAQFECLLDICNFLSKLETSEKVSDVDEQVKMWAKCHC